MKTKLTTKDLIAAGAFGAIYLVVLTVHMLEYMMVPFLMQCSVVVDEMSAAVMARGFDRDTRRSSYIEVKLSILDWCIITVSAGILAWNLIV